MNLIFVIGATNAGKSTLIEAAKHLGHGTVEVGKAMRAKHPPEYFQGSAAPEHTEIEAWQCLLDGIAASNLAHSIKYAPFGGERRAFCFIDGQPRSLKQYHKVRRDFPYYQTTFVHLWAPNTEREIRARNRDKGDPAKLALSLARLNGDIPVLYDMLFLMAQEHLPIQHVNTNAAKYDAQVAVKCAVAASSEHALGVDH
jgi:hypothetical protein